MIRKLKSAKPVEAQNAINAEVSGVVSRIVADVAERGDIAVREYSEKFDKWNPETFRLSAKQVADCVAQLSKQELDDIKFAQAQVRRFAEAQLSTLSEVEIETIPGVILGHKNIPVQSVACYVPGVLAPTGN